MDLGCFSVIPCLFHFFHIMEPFFPISIFHETEFSVWPQTCDAPALVLLVLEIQICTIQISFFRWFRIVLCVFANTVCIHVIWVCMCVFAHQVPIPWLHFQTKMLSFSQLCACIWLILIESVKQFGMECIEYCQLFRWFRTHLWSLNNIITPTTTF